MNNLMNRKKNQKGFTLMEMLIVVAIIAILVAILIPTVTKSLNKSKEATDIANLRSNYATTQMEYMTNPEGDLVYTLPDLNFISGSTDSGKEASGLLGVASDAKSGDDLCVGKDVMKTYVGVEDPSQENRTFVYYAKATDTAYKVVIGPDGCFEEIETSEISTSLSGTVAKKGTTT